MPVHYEIEVLDGALSQPLCENNAGRDAFEDADCDVEMTTLDHEVTCHACLEALGYVIPQDEAQDALLDMTVKQLTGDRWQVAA